jgi:hypothetical protein
MGSRESVDRPEVSEVLYRRWPGAVAKCLGQEKPTFSMPAGDACAARLSRRQQLASTVQGERESSSHDGFPASDKLAPECGPTCAWNGLPILTEQPTLLLS